MIRTGVIGCPLLGLGGLRFKLDCRRARPEAKSLVLRASGVTGLRAAGQARALARAAQRRGRGRFTNELTNTEGSLSGTAHGGQW